MLMNNKLLRWVAALVWALALNLQAQTLSTNPVLNRTIPVKPNVLLVMDDSGSMAWDCIYTAAVNMTSPYVDVDYGYPYGVVREYNGLSHDCLAPTNLSTTGTFSSASHDLRQFSVDSNLLAYDPLKVYLPAYDTNGNAMPAATVTSSFANQEVYRLRFGQPLVIRTSFNSTTTLVVNSATDLDALARDVGGAVKYAAMVQPSSGASYSISTAITWQDMLKLLTSLVNYDRYVIKYDTAEKGFCKKSPATDASACSFSAINPVLSTGVRTDCVKYKTYCSLNEEMQNIANWRTYHSSRMAAAKVGLGVAFAGRPDTFRLSWMTICDRSPRVTMRDWGYVTSTVSTRKDFYTFLNGAKAALGCGTPLPRVLNDAGTYFTKTANNGPWGNIPWNAQDTNYATGQLSCRRSYTILETDGYWNTASDSVTFSINDVDGAVATTISAGANSYKYQPRVMTDPRSVGKADRITSTASGYANTLADVAMKYWVTDLRTDLANSVPQTDPTVDPFWQNMTTYTVGLGTVGTLGVGQLEQAKAGLRDWPLPSDDTASTVDDLVHAARNGGGQYYYVTDAITFAEQLGRLLDGISARQYSEAGVSASSGSFAAGVATYVTEYTSNQWWGNLRAYAVDAQKQRSLLWSVVNTNPAKNNTAPLPNGDIVSGGGTLPAFNQRNIVVWKDATNGAVPFTWAEVSKTGSTALRSATVSRNNLVNSVSQELVDFLRGDRSNESGSGASLFRARQSIFGDIVGSTPVLIRSVNTDPIYDKLGLSGYSAYLAAKKGRSAGALVVGGNDGMAHVFRDSDGLELLAYVPRGVLGKLDQLGSRIYQHQFYVDGPVVEADAYLYTGNSSRAWTNLAVGTLGAGGQAVYALKFGTADPTANLDTSSVLWEINSGASAYAQLGSVLSAVQTGVMRDGTWVAVFGNGYDSALCRSRLYMANLEDGALVKEIVADSSSLPLTSNNCASSAKNGLGGVTLVRNANGEIIGAYAGDLQGNLWKFNLDSTSRANWQLGNGGSPLFVAKDTSGTLQPITAAAAVVPRVDQPTYPNSRMVVLGTGKLHDVEDQTSKAQQSAYGLWDRYGFSSSSEDLKNDVIASRSKLVPVSVGNTFITMNNASGSLSSASAGSIDFYAVSASRTADWVNDRGWVQDFRTPGDRNVYPVQSFEQDVKIETVAPVSTLYTCTVQQASGFNMWVTPLNGSCNALQTFDTNGDGKINNQDAVNCAYATQANGLDATLKQPPVNSSDVYTGGTGGLGGSGGGGTPPVTSALDSLVTSMSANGFVVARVNQTVSTSPTFTRRAWRQIFLR